MTFYINGTGMGQLYNDSVADLQFPHPRKLVKPCNKGHTSPYHIIPKSEWVSHQIENAKDVEVVIEDLFRFQHNRPAK